MEKSHLERQVGGKFALFLAVYPWVTMAVGFTYIALQGYARPGQTPFGFRVMEKLVMALLAVGIFLLFPVGLVWWVGTLVAWRRGFVSGWLFLACTVLGFGGAVILFVILAQQ